MVLRSHRWTANGSTCFNSSDNCGLAAEPFRLISRRSGHELGHRDRDGIQLVLARGTGGTCRDSHLAFLDIPNPKSEIVRMLIGLLMLLLPGVVFVLTIPFSGRLKPGVRAVYRYAGGIVVFLGSGISFYLASYTGDQGGIAAFFFQIAVISVYAILSISLVVLNWFLTSSGAEDTES